MIRLSSKIRIRRFKKDGLSFFICFFITLMLLSEMYETVLPGQCRYIDEIFAVIAIIYIACYLLFGNSLKKLASLILGCTAIMVLCGVFGNIIFSLHYSAKSVVLDLFLFLKIYVSLLFFILTITKERASDIYAYLLALSKLFLWLLAIFAFIDVLRNGITGLFSFYYKYYGSLAWWAILFFSIIYSDRKCNRLLYFFLTAILVTKNGSGLGLLSLGTIVVIYLFVERSKKIKWHHFAVMLIV